ncbi:hypothetical protein WJX72_004562 [[Myrmecia] bisecta]|uniref:Uncharacterized protein n=1 Tax=[Myrmecia] bisecta TaxID=41462 RepID=A0AAW1PVN8_9CHLO
MAEEPRRLQLRLLLVCAEELLDSLLLTRILPPCLLPLHCIANNGFRLHRWMGHADSVASALTQPHEGSAKQRWLHKLRNLCGLGVIALLTHLHRLPLPFGGLRMLLKPAQICLPGRKIKGDVQAAQQHHGCWLL